MAAPQSGNWTPLQQCCAYLFPVLAPEQISLIDGSHPDLELDNASLASQAVGPPLSNLEMSFDGATSRSWAGRWCPVAPLAQQLVAPMTAFWAP